ncbi:MAG TPA: EAL domain-containing protein [Candidatus Polarisedimenticolia bacterium]|nr:EAL domain-containing protein [Candidatus Polarisedimenticolia bacterium]
MRDLEAARQLRRALRVFGLIVLPLAGAWLVVAAVMNDLSSFLVGTAGLLFGAFMLIESRISGERSASSIATRAAVVTEVAIFVAVTIEPSLAVTMTMTALIPPILAFAYADHRAVIRLTVVAGLVGTWAALTPFIVPWPTDLEPPLSVLLPVSSLVLGYVVFLMFLLNASNRQRETADDLRTAVAMSRELSQTLDPQLIGDLIARHLVQATEATDCALSTWDRPGDRVVTHGYYPSERRHLLEGTYDLTEYPATRRVLENQEACFVDLANPQSDPREVAYLAGIGQRSMVILPLVVHGESVGTVELTSDRSGVFTTRRVELAAMLSREAATALENARLYDQIHDQAFRDPLTGLANRTLFHDRVKHVLDRLRGRSQQRAAVLFLDIDHFKLLNDKFGHSRGDDVLRVVADRVRWAIRPGDTAARLGGDEFAILLEDVDAYPAARLVANRLLDSLAAPITLADGSPTVGASVGVALSGVGGETVDDLLRNADIAMYAAKAAGRGRIELFRPELLEQAAARSDLGARLRRAADRGELRLEYQPIVELAGGGIVGLEALVRWQPPDRPLQYPADFIAMAEETGEIIPIGRWVINEACRQIRIWQERYNLPELRANVNISARQFKDPDLVAVVAGALADNGLPAHCLTLEITESTLMLRTTETMARVGDLRALGTRLSIDDFGTGYSSLGYLQAFQVDELKLDRSFVSDPTEIGNPMVLSRAIVELARALGLEMVVEGVESVAQADWFASLGCSFAQGFFFARPLAPESAERFLERAPRPMTVGEGNGVVPARERRRARAAQRPSGGRNLRLVSGEGERP